MSKVIFTIGCSASGKTTWAEQQPNHQIICRDDIRKQLMPDFSWAKWDWKKEPEVTKIQREQIDHAISSRANVIIADTNLHPGIVGELTRPFDAAGYVVEYKRFDVDFETLLKRDLHRGPMSVGAKVIAQQWDKMKLNWPTEIEYRLRKLLKTSGDPCFICDIDGTIANHEGVRGHYDLTLVSKDNVVLPVKTLVMGAMKQGLRCVFLSGREGTEQCELDTKEWLRKWIGAGDWTLLMRKAGDSRKDNIVKLELLEVLLQTGMRPQFAIDDRGRVCRAWRSVGLFTLQVGNPYIEF